MKLFFAIAICALVMSAQGTMYLFSGNDVYGEGLSYPNLNYPYIGRSLIAPELSGGPNPVLVGKSIGSPEIVIINSSGLFEPTGRALVLRTPPANEMKRYNDVHRVNQIEISWRGLDARWTPVSSTYVGPGVSNLDFDGHEADSDWGHEPGSTWDDLSSEEFLEEDDWEAEGPDRRENTGLVRFLEDNDDIPGRPLL